MTIHIKAKFLENDQRIRGIGAENFSAVLSMQLVAEGRTDAARFLKELAIRIEQDEFTKKNWSDWFDVLDRTFKAAGNDYASRLRAALLYEFISMVMRTSEDLGIMILASESSADLGRAAAAIFDHREGAVHNLYAGLSNKDATWYDAILRLPSPAGLPDDERDALHRINEAERLFARLLLADVAALRKELGFWRAYNKLKHGGLAAPSALAFNSANAGTDLSPFLVVWDNRPEPFEGGVLLPVSVAALSRYEELLEGMRFLIERISAQILRTASSGRPALPPHPPLPWSGFGETDRPLLLRLYDRWMPEPDSFELAPNPPAFNADALLRWIQNPPRAPPPPVTGRR